MRSSHQYEPEDIAPTAIAQDVVELVERRVLTLIDPSLLSNFASYASAAQSASTQQNVIVAQQTSSVRPRNLRYCVRRPLPC
jgi:hypothetical protein